MDSLKKIFSAFLLTILILVSSSITFAEPQEFSAEGEYRLGDRDNRETAKMAALADAKRKIVEQVGIYVQSFSEMNNSNLTKDQITTAANAMIKTKSEEINFYENGVICRAFVVAIVDTENIEKYIPQITVKPDPTPTPVVPEKNSPDIKLLESLGFIEHAGHYYKAFDEGMNWQDANKRCREIGGHLVTITSKEEQHRVQDLFFEFECKKNYYWTGGFSVRNDQWEWITREEFTYSNWADGEPNNDLGNEFILSIYKTTGKWNDCPAEGISHIPDMDFFKIENSGFICEWDSYDDIKR